MLTSFDITNDLFTSRSVIFISFSAVKDFVSNIKALNKKYNCEPMIVGTSVEAKKPEVGKVIMSTIINAAMNETDGHCTGVFYWAPEAEGDYPLGAFENHRATIIMDAFTEAAKSF